MNETKRTPEFTVTRIFDAPRELVWKAWTEPERLKRWWGPRGYTAPVVKIDFHVGGKYLYLMRSREGIDAWSTGVFKEIEPQKRIVVVDSFADKDGNIVPASYYGMGEGFPPETQITITFEDLHGKTRLTLRYADVSNLGAEDLRNMEIGWNESLDKLQETLLTPLMH
jgi:uncharacterized protein YndB with AHSA1/START domain